MLPWSRLHYTRCCSTLTNFVWEKRGREILIEIFSRLQHNSCLLLMFPRELSGSFNIHCCKTIQIDIRQFLNWNCFKLLAMKSWKRKDLNMTFLCSSWHVHSAVPITRHGSSIWNNSFIRPCTFWKIWDVYF